MEKKRRCKEGHASQEHISVITNYKHYDHFVEKVSTQKNIILMTAIEKLKEANTKGEHLSTGIVAETQLTHSATDGGQ